METTRAPISQSRHLSRETISYLAGEEWRIMHCEINRGLFEITVDVQTKIPQSDQPTARQAVRDYLARTFGTRYESIQFQKI